MWKNLSSHCEFSERDEENNERLIEIFKAKYSFFFALSGKEKIVKNVIVGEVFP